MYTLRIPLRLPAGLAVQTDAKQTRHGDFLLWVEESAPGYALFISGLVSVEAAESLALELEAGLLWVLLESDLPFIGDHKLRLPAYSNAPQPLSIGVAGRRLLSAPPADGVFASSQVTAYPTGKTLNGLGGRVDMVNEHSSEAITGPLCEWLSLSERAAILADMKLKLAIELYGGYFREESVNAKFLTLIMALECLGEETPKPSSVLHLMNGWKPALDEAIQSSEGEERAGFEALKRELSFRQGLSISGQLRALMIRAFSANDPEKATRIGKRVVQLYSLRGELVHTGKSEESIGGVLLETRAIVHDVLRTLAQRAVRI